MIAGLRGHVLLDEADAVYVTRALELLERLLRENRATPTRKLQSVVANLRKTTANIGGCAPNASPDANYFAPQADCVDDAGYASIGTGEAARILGVTPNAVRDAARRGRIRATRPRGRWIYPAAAIEQLAERKQQSRASATA
ncbi:helix-turn-helix domain-containing protein [Mycobacterium intracellulare]|uniref:helix-turn-helix domain-containing protein n=1 Tax=Mycobacterium intracellulare TaxID=1767 RepID=UPI0034D741AA